MPESQKLPTAAQIDAAQRLYKHEKMEYWRLQDKILTELKDENSSLTDQRLTLVKATLVNSFYNAGCRDIEEVTSWIVAQKPDLLEEYRRIDSNDNIGHIDFVKRIASYGRKETEGCLVFASKFAHFFIDTGVFPIYDQYARMLTNFHINTSKGAKQPHSKYGVFYKKFFRLKQLLEQRDSVSYSTKTLDCYLWSAGQYVAWEKGIRKKFFYINKRIPFDAPDNKPLFEMLFPQAMIEDVLDDLLLSELDWGTRKRKEAWKKGRDEKNNGTQT